MAWKARSQAAVPGVLPLVRHRDDVLAHQVVPLVVALRLRPLGGAIGQPAVDVVVVELLAPEHAGQRLADDPPPVVRQGRGDDVVIERVRLVPAGGEGLGERIAERGLQVGEPEVRAVRDQRRTPREAKAQLAVTLRRNVHDEVRRGLRPGPAWVDRLLPAVHDGVVDPVLEVASLGGARRPGRLGSRGVGLVVDEQQLRARLAEEQQLAEGRAVRADDGQVAGQGVEDRARLDALPPGVSKPERRQQRERGRLAGPVEDRDLDEQILGRRLRVLDVDVEVPVIGERARVDQLVLELVAGAPAVGLDQIEVRERPLRVLVQVPHVGMRRRAVEVEVVLLDVLAVIPFGVGEAEEPLLEDRIVAVPQRQREAEDLSIVRYAGEAILAPAVGARSSEVVTEMVPGVAVGAVVFANRPPLSLAQVGPPLSPGSALVARGEESLLLFVHSSRSLRPS